MAYNPSWLLHTAREGGQRNHVEVKEQKRIMNNDGEGRLTFKVHCTGQGINKITKENVKCTSHTFNELHGTCPLLLSKGHLIGTCNHFPVYLCNKASSKEVTKTKMT